MDDDALRRQYDSLIERAGLRIPEDRDATMFAAYKQVQVWSDVVHMRRPGSAEPSNAFALTTISRLAAPGDGGAA